MIFKGFHYKSCTYLSMGDTVLKHLKGTSKWETLNQAEAKGPYSWQKSYAEERRKKHLPHWACAVWFSTLQQPKMKLEKCTKKRKSVQ